MRKSKTEIIYTSKFKSFLFGMGAGVWIFSFGCFALLIPFIGLFLFLSALVAAVALPFAMLFPHFRRAVRGQCPRCKRRIVALAYFKSILCQTCHNRILITPKGFEIV